jgi:hypothetical protein
VLVDRSIDFDDELLRGTAEVDHERADDMLPPELPPPPAWILSALPRAPAHFWSRPASSGGPPAPSPAAAAENETVALEYRPVHRATPDHSRVTLRFPPRPSQWERGLGGEGALHKNPLPAPTFCAGD